MARAALKECPICGKPAGQAFRPFCSSRCANIDLGRWLGEKYSMPTEERISEIKKPDEDTDIE